jgi:hypothetical protein
MDKNQIISFIEEQVAAGRISREELAAIAGTNFAIDQATQQTAQSASSSIPGRKTSSWGIINTMYLIGALIVIIGIAILLGQHWDEIGMLGRILSTMGIAVVTYFAGIALRRPNQSFLSQTMFLISAVLAPFSMYVVLHEAGIVFNAFNQTISALILLVVFSVAYFIRRQHILVIVMVGLASWAYYAFLDNILSPVGYDFNWVKWATIFLGTSYILIATGYQTAIARKGMPLGEGERSVSDILYGLGTFAVLLAGISLGGIWDFVFILVIFAAFYLSVYVKSRAMLLFAALFLMVHAVRLTSKYFVGSVGWPVSLIVCGFLVIAIGYLTYHLNRRYLSH